MTRALDQLPKAHLHVHLEGAMRPSTLAEFAAQNGAPVPDVRGYRDLVERSEERRVGKECTIQCRSRWSPYH